MKGKGLNMSVSNHVIGRQETVVSIDTTPIECSLSDLREIRLKMVSGSSSEFLWNTLVREYHYLGHQRMFGRRLKYLAFADSRPIAALGWKTASIRLEARDCFIGWSDEQRKKYLKHVVNNNRFLIPHWIRVPNLASHLLASGIKAVSRDWHERYGQKPFLLETIVDPVYFRGTSYKAANWRFVGKTKGYSLGSAGYEYHGLVKEVYVYVVERDMRKIIGCQQRPFLWKCPISQKKEKANSMIIQRADYDPDLIDWEGLTPEVIEKMAEELVAFHDEFRDAFCRVEQSILGQYYLQGLLGEIRRKNVEAMALKYLEASRVRSLQKFMTNYRWDDTVLLAKAQAMLSELIAEEKGMISLDGSDIPKKGNESVGVAIQYCGNTGKTDKCQAGVFVGYTSTKGYGLIERELYMPERWFSEDYAERRAKCQVPEDLVFKTKNQIGLELIRKILDTKLFPAEWVGFDASFGCDSKFRDAVESLELKYLGDIKSNTLVWLNRPEVGIPTYSGRGRPAEKEQVLAGEEPPVHVSDIANDPELEWETTILAEGAQGPIIAQLCFMRVVEYRDGLPGKDLWLVMRRDTDGKLRYAFSNAPVDISKEELRQALTMRWPIEQSFEDGKKYLGMDHYEHRSWPGWHRHMSYVILAQLFLLRLRLNSKKNSLH
ncbi:MAG: IS701 family transposase [Candidatus Thorarchaeota archaeon]